MGSSNENSAFGPVLNPWDRTPVPGRLLGRQRRRGGGRAGAVGDRHRHRRLDPPARGAVRDRRAQADLRRLLALRDDRVRLLAGPGRPADPRRDRRRAAVLAHGRPRPARLDLGRLPRADRSCPPRRGPPGHPARRPRGAARRRGRRRASSPGSGRTSRPRCAWPRSSAPTVAALPPAARAPRAVGLLPDRAGRGLGQPGALRRRALRAAGGRRRRSGDDVQPHAGRRASAPRSSGGSCSAPTRSPAATTTPTTARRRRCGPRSPRTSAPRSTQFDFVVTPTSPWVAFELGAKTADPLAMYLNDFCTVPMPLAGIPAISIPSGLSRRPAGRLPARRARRSARTGCWPRPTRSSRRSASTEPRPGDERRGQRPGSLGAGHRAGDPRPAQDAHEDVLRLRAVLRRSAQHAHLPGLPGPARRAAGAQRPGGRVRGDDRPGARARRSRRARSFTARTTSIPTRPRATRSPSTTCRCAAAGGSATCGSTACTSRRTRPSSSTSARAAGSTARTAAWSTSTAAARRWSRSSPSPTCTRPSRPTSG